MASRRMISLILACAIASAAGAGPEDWPHYGHSANRQAIAVDGPNTINNTTLAWVADTDPQDPNYNVEFESFTGPVVYNGKVYAYAKYYDPSNPNYPNCDSNGSQIIAYDANSGQILWATVIDQAVWDSWSTPCVDTKHNTVLIGSGDKVFALDANSGAQQWATQLNSSVINASVCTALDIPNARAFITDYDGSGSTGMLYCINLDPNKSNNPYEPGEIVWSDTIGRSSGNSPAYKNGVVYVASTKGVNSNYGTIYAYNATVAPNAVRLWERTNPNFEGFFGGVTVTKEGFLYAANYNFYGDEDNSALCKIDCNNGGIVWITQTERTDSTPIVVGDKIYICGGLEDYGRPKVEAYRDLGTSVTKLWETGTNMIVGGWTNQLAYANGKLYVGTISSGGDWFIGPYTDLYILDVVHAPNEPQFTAGHYKGGGNSPAVTYDSIYTIGDGGLFKFHQPALLGDINKDMKVDMYDLAKFIDNWLYDGPVGVIRSDLDLDGDVNFIDFSMLAEKWREQLN